MGDIIRRCEDCGKVLPEGSGTRRLYCDACRKLRKRETDHACYQKRSAREAKKTACGAVLHRVRQGAAAWVFGEP